MVPVACTVQSRMYEYVLVISNRKFVNVLTFAVS